MTTSAVEVPGRHASGPPVLNAKRHLAVAEGRLRGVVHNHPRLETGASGTPMCRLEIRVDGETFVAFATGAMAEECSALTRGQWVEVEGPLLNRAWRTGRQERKEMQIQVRMVQCLTS